MAWQGCQFPKGPGVILPLETKGMAVWDMTVQQNPWAEQP